MSVRRAAAAVVFAAVWACGLPSAPDSFEPGDGTPAPLTLSAGQRVAYVLDWAWDDAVFAGGAFVFETDLGYEIGIESMYLAAFSVQLVPCETAARRTWSWQPSSARADHVVVDDASILISNTTDDATVGWRELGAGVAAGGTYCHAFLLATPLEGEAPALDGNAVVIEGWYRAPGGERASLDARVPLGNGALATLAAAVPERVSLDDGLGARVVVTRYPARAFDGVEPESLDRLELGWEVLENLLGATTARWQLDSP